MVHLPSSADRRPEKNTNFGPSYLSFFSKEGFRVFLRGILSGFLSKELGGANSDNLNQILMIFGVIYIIFS